MAILAVAFAVQRANRRVEVYQAGEQSEGLFDSLARDVPEDHPRVRFTDVAAQSGLSFRHFPATRTNKLPEDMGSGVALGDVDGDGWCDVFLGNVAGAFGSEHGDDGASRLFLGGSGGSFRDVTRESGVAVNGLVNGVAFADVDSDGDLDLFVAGYDLLCLFENDGAAHFEDVSSAAGLGGRPGFWSGIAVGDYDANGTVDVYVCGYVVYHEDLGSGEAPSQYGRVIPALINPSTFEPERNLMFSGNGDGTFREVAEELGIDDPHGRGLGALFCDVDGDGLQDLYVANDVSDNALFLGRPGGGFVDRTAEAQVGDYRGAMGLAAGDFDGDHDLDLFVTHWVSQENALYRQHQVGEQNGGTSSPIFFDDADRLGLGHKALDKVGWATAFFDYDNDGLLDLYVVNGSTIPLDEDRARMEPMRSQLFWHSNDERSFFHEVGAVSGDFFREKYVGRGGANFDYDLDGDEDLVVVQHGGPAFLLRNDGGNDRPSVRVRLRQPEGNRFALGARVFLTAGGRTRLEVVGAQGSYLSQRAVGEVGFGLGDATVVEELRVVWPDGAEDLAGPFLPNSLVEWTRGAPPRTKPFPGRRDRDAAGPRDVSDQRRFYAVRDRAQAKRVSGDFTGAIDEYFAALALWPGHEDCLYYLANCLIETGDEHGALAALERMVFFQPRSSGGWMQIGRIRLPGGARDLDDIEMARFAFQQSHALNSEESGPRLMLAIVEMLAGELESAASGFAEAARLNPRSVEARWFGGRVAYLRGDLDEARALLERSRALAAEGQSAGASASNEGDTASGEAMVSQRGIPLDPLLRRWTTTASRALDVEAEYGPAAPQ
ncbi:MAG: VCBS repeat-containing protein [Planctomycetes bacterium]|nr:VCBS repeat-containing protein [Planctomycetota bacterium]MCB9905550.1 VCBS repeat-containing protein [Planctomycetota bacterium]